MRRAALVATGVAGFALCVSGVILCYMRASSAGGSEAFTLGAFSAWMVHSARVLAESTVKAWRLRP